MSLNSDTTLSLPELHARYKQGVSELLRRMGHDHPRHNEALVYQQRLLENLGRGLYGEDSARDAERSEILSQLESLTFSVLGLTFYELCKIMPAYSETAFSQQVEFVNRDHELRLLNVDRLKAASSPYVLISAPAGYGKTYLLQRLIYTVQTDEVLRRTWATIYVDCGQLPTEQVGGLIQALTGQPLQGTSDEVNRWVRDFIVNELGGPLPQDASGRWAVLLILDTIEQLKPSCQQWMATLLDGLRKKTRLRTRSGYEEIVVLRIIIAGRVVDPFWETYTQVYPKQPAPKRIALSPFDEHPIQELIWLKAKAAQVQQVLDDRTVADIADEVQYLSGGHPRVIRNLVEHLADQSFAMDLLPSEYFAQNRESLVQAHLRPVAAALLENLPEAIRETVRVLSVFRRINANTVQRLVESSLLTSETDEVTLLSALLDAHLLEKPTIQEPFYRDHVMRRIMALDMSHGQDAFRTKCLQLNRLALDLYEGWIQQGLQDSYRGPIQRLLSVIEWLFHALQDETIDSALLRTKTQTHIQIVCENPGTDDIVDLLVDEIKKDAEIRYLLRHRLGENGVDMMCDWLNVASQV